VSDDKARLKLKSELWGIST